MEHQDDTAIHGEASMTASTEEDEPPAITAANIDERLYKVGTFAQVRC